MTGSGDVSDRHRNVVSDLETDATKKTKMARNLYFTGIEELEESMRAIPDVDLEKLLVVKQILVKLLHNNETSSSSSTHPYRRFGSRNIDSSRINLRNALLSEDGSDDAAIRTIINAVFVDPTPQYEIMTTLLGRYRRYIEDMLGSDSDSD